MNASALALVLLLCGVQLPPEQPPHCPVCPMLADGGALRKCGSCKAVRYCSQECQAAHWPMHKGPCKRLRQQQEEQQKKAAAVS